MDFFVVLLTAAVNIVLGLFSYIKNPKSNTNKLLAILTFILAFWSIANYYSLNSPTEEQTLFWVRMVMLITSPLGPVIFLFLSVFPKSELQIKKTTLIILIMATFSVASISFTPLMFSKVDITNGVHPTPGIGLMFYGILLIGSLIAGFKVIFEKYKKSAGIIKQQLQYLVLGVIVTFTLQAFTNFVLVVFNVSFLVVLGPTFSLVLVGFIFYAIIKHRFLDIRLVVARTVAYTLLVLSIAVFYVLVVFNFSELILGKSIDANQAYAYSVVTLLIAFTFQSIKHVLQGITDKIFYKDIYNPQKLIKDFSEIMNSTIDLEALTLNILEKVRQDMKVTRGAFALLSKNNNQSIEYIEQKGYDHAPDFSIEDINTFFANKNLIILDELEEGFLKELMRNLNATAVLKLEVNAKRIGILFLGEKASGDIYSQQDVDVFEILAPQLSIAIQNSQEYEEIKQFNVTLKEKVERETRQLTQANEKLKELDKLKDEFVSLASHELRTPMTAIKSYLWMAIAGKGGELSEKQKYYLDRAYNSTDRLIKLVNDMLNVSRIESGRIKLEVIKVSIQRLLRDVVEELLPRAQELGITLQLVCPQVLPDVMADGDKIKEVIINLIGNSLKFTPQGGSITLSCLEKNEMLEIKVCDTGEGLSGDDMQRLFQKFGILGNDILKKKNNQGTGLGLYISKSIIELHGGKIWAQSEGLGKGATFTFTLPIFKKEGVNIVSAPVAPNN